MSPLDWAKAAALVVSGLVAGALLGVFVLYALLEAGLAPSV